MTLTIGFSPEVERRLQELAAATGKDAATLVREAVEEKLRTTAPEPLSPEERLRRFNAWIEQVRQNAPKYPEGFQVDDSRESIYEGRGE